MKDLIKESLRWSAQAEDDFRFVAWMKKEDAFHDKICFMAQQAGEKMLKACLHATGKRKIWGHSLAEMVLLLAKEHPLFLQIDREAKRLDRFYIAARYPNGLPGLSPFEVYSAQDSADAYADLEKTMKVCREFLQGKTRHTPPAMSYEP
jgi:HEPN domain-containing protein